MGATGRVHFTEVACAESQKAIRVKDESDRASCTLLVTSVVPNLTCTRRLTGCTASRMATVWAAWSNCRSPVAAVISPPATVTVPVALR